MTEKIVQYNGNKRELDHIISLTASFRIARNQGQWKTALDILLKIHDINPGYADALYGELSYENRAKIHQYA